MYEVAKLMKLNIDIFTHIHTNIYITFLHLCIDTTFIDQLFIIDNFKFHWYWKPTGLSLRSLARRCNGFFSACSIWGKVDGHRWKHRLGVHDFQFCTSALHDWLIGPWSSGQCGTLRKDRVVGPLPFMAEIYEIGVIRSLLASTNGAHPPSKWRLKAFLST